jgi:hypothetical protein
MKLVVGTCDMGHTYVRRITQGRVTWYSTIFRRRRRSYEIHTSIMASQASDKMTFSSWTTRPPILILTRPRYQYGTFY